jgi:hypothetical protein
VDEVRKATGPTLHVPKPPLTMRVA